MGTISSMLVIMMSIVYGVILILGFTVYKNNPNRVSHRFFYVLSLTFVLWLVANSLQLVTDGETAIVFNYIDYTVAPWVAYGLFMFLLHVPHYNLAHRAIRYMALVLPALASILVMTDQVIRDVTYNGSITVSQHGPFYDMYSVLLLGFLCGGLGILGYRIITVKGTERKQLLFILISALTVFATLFVVNLLFGRMINSTMQVALNNLSLVWILILGVGIKQHLFNLRIFSFVLIRGTVLIALSVLLLTTYETLDGAVSGLFSEDLTFRILLCVVTIPIFISLYYYFQQHIERILSQNKSVIHYLNNDLITINKQTIEKPSDITSVVDQTIYKLLGVYPTWVFQQKNSWNLSSKYLTEDYQGLDFEELSQMLSFQTEPFVAATLKKESMPGSKKNQLANVMHKHKLAVIYPLYRTGVDDEKNIYGFLLLNDESPFVGTQELSYITMLLPQITESLYRSTID